MNASSSAYVTCKSGGKTYTWRFTGVTSIEHGTFIDEEAAEMMVEKGTFLVPTLVVDPRMFANMKPGEIAPNVIAKAERCTAVHAKNIGMAYRKGVKIAFGTDVCAPYLYHGTQAEEFVYMVNEAGMTPADALIAATRNASELLGWADKLGTINYELPCMLSPRVPRVYIG